MNLSFLSFDKKKKNLVYIEQFWTLQDLKPKLETSVYD